MSRLIWLAALLILGETWSYAGWGEITLSDGSVAQCDTSTRVKDTLLVFCKSHDGSFILGRADDGTWNLVGKDSKTNAARRVALTGVIQVKEDHTKETLFAANRKSHRLEAETTLAEDQYQLKQSSFWLQALVRFSQDKTLNAELLAWAASYLDQADRIEKAYLDHPSVIATLEDGSQVRCTRGAASRESKKASTCDLYHCEPIRLAGVEYSPLLFKLSHPSHRNKAPLLTLTTADYFGPHTRVVSIELGEKPPKYIYKHNPLSLDTHLDPKDATEYQSAFSASCSDPEISTLIAHQRLLLAQHELSTANKNELIELIDFVDGFNTQLKPKSLFPVAPCSVESPPRRITQVKSYSAIRHEDQLRELQEIPKEFIPEERAQELFQILKASSIPFEHKIDGCHARAHAAIQLIAQQGVSAHKLWLAGGKLSVRSTPYVLYSYHVAPAVQVQRVDGSFATMVLDPSLFNHAVTDQEWAAEMLPKQNQGGVDYVGFPPPPTENLAFYKKYVLSQSSAQAYHRAGQFMSEEEINQDVSTVLRRQTEILERKNMRGAEPIHQAVFHRDVTTLAVQLMAKANPNVQTASGWTPLHFAAKHGLTAQAEVLLEKGAWIGAKTSKNKGVFHLAVKARNLEMVQLLTEHYPILPSNKPERKALLEYAQAVGASQAIQAELTQLYEQ